MDKSPPSFVQAVLAVLSAFIGIRKGKSSLADQGVKPAHIVLAGLIAGAVFVATLIVIVRIIIRAAGA
jgi:hypothetical protein